MCIRDRVPTIVEGVNTDNIGDMMDFLVEHVNVVKGIHFQPVSFFGRHPEHAKNKEKDAAQSGDFPGRITMFGLLRKLERQRPQFRYENFCPIATGHTLCCFYSTYIKEPDSSVRCTLTQSQKERGIQCCDTGHAADRDMDVIKRDRDFVVNKWEIAPPEKQAEESASRYRSSACLLYTSKPQFEPLGPGKQKAPRLVQAICQRCI